MLVARHGGFVCLPRSSIEKLAETYAGAASYPKASFDIMDLSELLAAEGLVCASMLLQELGPVIESRRQIHECGVAGAGERCLGLLSCGRFVEH